MIVNESQEMYLETILKLKRTQEVVRAIDVVKCLGYSKPSVSRAMKLLVNEGLITIQRGKIDFTLEGDKKAKAVLERHNVLTKALVMMGLSKGEAEDNACRVEHVLSQEAFNKIKEYFKI